MNFTTRACLLGATLGVLAAGTGRADDPARPSPPPVRRLSDMAGSVESGLQMLAEDIVAKSTGADRNKIAVLSFPNADNTCSVLSNYLSDELIGALFSVPGSHLELVERNQLTAILNELKLDETHLLDPATTKKIGSVSGVQGLVIGTVTQIGDRVRVNARLISTDTASLFSAAAVTIPRTGEVDNLLRQPVPNENGICGAHSISLDAKQPQTASSPNGGGGVAPLPASREIRSVTLDGINFNAQTVSRSADRKSMSVVLALTNQTDQPVQMSLIAPRPGVIDDAANQAYAASVNGLPVCGGWNWGVADCKAASERLAWTTLSPQLPTTLHLVFGLQSGEFTGNKLSLAVSLLKAPTEKMTAAAVKNIDLSLANLQISSAK